MTNFVGQKVPSGLHYRINMETGYKEAKILENHESKTSLTTTMNENSENIGDDEKTRLRLEQALKNIPSDKYDDMTEEKNPRTYEKLKDDLKELKLEMKSENDLLTELVDRFMKIARLNDAELLGDTDLAILEDISYLCHSIDNSEFFISIGGLEDVIIPNLIQTSNIGRTVMSLRALGVILQNNNFARNYVLEKTKIANFLIDFLSKSASSDQLSASLFAMGALMRNNQKLPLELYKNGVSRLIEIIAAEKSLSLRVKALTLVGDLLDNQLYESQHSPMDLCGEVENLVVLNRDGLIANIDYAEKVVNSLISLQGNCQLKWSESPILRHNLLSLEAYFNEESASESRSSLQNLTISLYGHLNITEDDLSHKLRAEEL